MWHPFAWVTGPCTEAILRAASSQSTPRSHLARSIILRGPVCLCGITTITSKSGNKTISPLDICNNLILFTFKLPSVFYFFVSEMNGYAQSLVHPEKRWYVRIIEGTSRSVYLSSVNTEERCTFIVSQWWSLSYKYRISLIWIYRAFPHQPLCQYQNPTNKYPILKRLINNCKSHWFNKSRQGNQFYWLEKITLILYGLLGKVWK